MEQLRTKNIKKQPDPINLEALNLQLSIHVHTILHTIFSWSCLLMFLDTATKPTKPEAVSMAVHHTPMTADQPGEFGGLRSSQVLPSRTSLKRCAAWATPGWNMGDQGDQGSQGSHEIRHV